MDQSKDCLDHHFADRFRHRYELESSELRETLVARIPPGGELGAAVEALFAHQIQAGVVRDDLGGLERFQLLDPADSSRAFYFTLNPRRAERHRGGGRTEPPTGWTPRHGNCYLCRANIAWQQRFLQLPLPIELSSGRFEAWANPFPLGDRHLTIAAEAHRPQRWQTGNAAASRATLLTRLRDLVELAGRLPGFLVFENGEGAGASIPQHHHYQALRRWPGLERFPIEEAAQATQAPPLPGPTLFPLRSYPVAALVLAGEGEALLARCGDALERWFAEDEEGGWEHLATNLLATRCRGSSGRILVFVVPRNGHINRSHGTGSQVASLEIAGEMVMSDDRARERIQDGRIGYRSVWETIASCQDTGSRRRLERIFAEGS